MASSLGYLQFRTTAISMINFRASPFVLSFGSIKSILFCLLILSIILSKYYSCTALAFSSLIFLSVLADVYCFRIKSSRFDGFSNLDGGLTVSFSAGFTVLKASSRA